MSAIEKFVHGAVIAVSKRLSRLLPDRVPVTFVGADATRELCESIAHAGHLRILVVTDAGLVEIGLPDRVTGALSSLGVDWRLYAGVEPDPTVAQAEAGLEELRR